jgi:hypothetical protein
VNRKQRNAFVAGVLTILGGGFTGKYLSEAAGASLLLAGAYLIGLAQKQPVSMRHPNDVGAHPREEA